MLWWLLIHWWVLLHMGGVSTWPAWAFCDGSLSNSRMLLCVQREGSSWCVDLVPSTGLLCHREMPACLAVPRWVDVLPPVHPTSKLQSTFLFPNTQALVEKRQGVPARSQVAQGTWALKKRSSVRASVGLPGQCIGCAPWMFYRSCIEKLLFAWLVPTATQPLAS